jgi:lambda family phage portal protein
MPRRKSQRSADELPAERQARRLRAQLEVQQLKTARKRMTEMTAALNIHQAADVGRRNADWRMNNGSADLAIIPDSTVLLGRARSMDRDSWTARSIKLAFQRNVVGGHGIVVTPHAKDKKGQPLTALNLAAQAEFKRWSHSKTCDVERARTFPQMQRMAIGEKTIAGEHFWMWSYVPPISPIQPVGLSMQAFEPEQLDLRVLSHEGREVRGGVEVDLNGAAVAYHFYTRNPNDVLYRWAFFSERVPASRVLHYFEADRVLQTRGALRLSPVMQDDRDLKRFREATLWRSFMEACIGLIIKQPIAGGGIGPGPLLGPDPRNPAGQTSNGMTTADMVPAMVARLVPGEEMESFIPTAAGNNYDPFTNLTVRGIAAGVGVSPGQMTRQSEGSYSSARQDMLEDRKTWEIEHEVLIADLIRPTYEIFFRLAVLEGRFDGIDGFSHDEFLAEPWRYLDAEFIPPPQTWIDPEKEANALAILLKNRLITREEIVALRGERIWNVTAKILAENKQLEGNGLSLPENAEEKAALRKLIEVMLGNRLGTIDNVAMNSLDEKQLVERCILPANPDFKQTQLPIVDQTAPAPTPAGAGNPAANSNPKPNGKANGNGKAAKLDAFGGPADRIRQLLADSLTSPPSGVPDYRDAEDPVQSCATCSFYVEGLCTRFNFQTQGDKLCDDWAARTVTENIGDPNVNGPRPGTHKIFPPGPQNGQPDLESRFYPQADPNAPESGT